MKIFELPDLGEGLPDAEVREWYVQVGDEVAVDQPLVAMETAKALVDVPSPFSGTIEKLFGEPGDTINTHDPLIGFAGDATAGAREDTGTVVGAIEASGDVLQEAGSGVTAAKASGARVKITPAVRSLAKKMGVDISNLIGTGPNGVITAKDVNHAAGNSPTTTKSTAMPEGFTALSGVRRAMIMSMKKSHADVVPVTLCEDADIHHWEGQDITVRLIRAIDAAAKAEPILNSHFDAASQSIHTIDEVNVAMAIDMPHGLFVPVIKDVANQSDSSLRETINTLKQLAKDKAIPQDDLHGGTIMLSNFGAFAGKYASPILTPPMVAIIGVGRSRKEIVPDADGNPVCHTIMPLSITVDHCAVTGGEATRFLKAMIDSLHS